MDPLAQLLLALISTILTAFLAIYFYQLKRSAGGNVPRAGGAWPIIGHLHLFGGRQLTHKTLGAMSNRYGSIFSIRLGSHRVLVLSSWEMARECFGTHDRVFSTRPITTASKILGYDLAMLVISPYGSYWREMRKIVTLELLSNRRLDMLKHVRVSEVETSLRELYDKWVTGSSTDGRVVVDMKERFGDLTHNLAVRLVAGKRFFGAGAGCTEEAQTYHKVMRDFFRLFGAFVLSDTIPFLGWLDLKGYEKAMKKTAKELDNLIGGWLEEHKQKRLLVGETKGDQDFMDLMLTILKDDQFHGFDADTINKATCLSMVLASDTTAVTLTWALSLLLNNRHVLRKAQEELDIQVGKDRLVDESDIKDLAYLQAIVKETLRLYPPSPVIAHREAMEDCIIADRYKVSAGTRIMVNVWKIHRDERVWPDPEEFQPERFLTTHKDIDVRGQNFELIPFSSGRRSCPGISLGLKLVHFTLARLLHSYQLETPSDEAVDMTESFGLTNLKATPLQVLISPRLDSRLYGE